MTHSEKQIEWKTRVDTWRTSGLSVAQWCREHDIKKHQMHYWIRKFKEETLEHNSSRPQWLAVNVNEEHVEVLRQDSAFIHFGSLSIEVRPGTSLSLVSDLVDILHNQC